ncbi:MAG TPA: FKBP-type peptidyl-prolyl cis-trans isomerase [Burkholderiales bacterium]
MTLRLVSPADAIAPELVMQDLIVGRGPLALPGDTIRVHYVAKLLDGTLYDSSRERRQPLEFALGMGTVMKGLEDGVRGMRVGGMRKLVIPCEHAYLEHGAPPLPVGGTVVYDVELLKVQ